MKRLLPVLMAVLCSVTLRAQLLTWSPAFPAENNPAQIFEITVDAAKGNGVLVNYTPTTDVYIHTGVITNLSTGPGDWKYVKFNQNFNQPNTALGATYLGNNKWKFTIPGSLRTYYGITNGGETIQKIALLFRNGAGTAVQRNKDGSDMYIPVYTTATAVRIVDPPTQPLYTPLPESQTFGVGTYTFKSVVSKTSAVTFFVNGQVITTATGVQDTLTVTSTFAAPGFYQVVVQATDGTTTGADTMNLTVGTPTAPVAALPAGVRDGINYEPGDTSAILVLHAPGKNLITVIGDFNNWTQTNTAILNKTPDGQKFWIRVKGLTPGTEYGYQYKVDDSIKIADPYTQKILDPADGGIPAATYPNLKPYPSGKTTGIVGLLQTAAPGYTWAVNTFARPDKRSLVVYELLVRDFVGAHNWNTVRDTLNYLKNLGVNAVEIMPFNEFEGNDSWGYNPDFYFAPDKYYGPKNTLKNFIDSCHSKGIAVIMDIALNHSFGQSPMVQLYFDRQANRPAANNPWFNPTARHPYNVGYDMNHESGATRYFTSRVAEHWLSEYKIDGFRFDLSKGFTQNNSCTTGNCDTGPEVSAWSNYDASRIAIWKRYYDTVQAKSAGAYTILEHFADNTEEKELADYGMLLWGNASYNYTEAAMGYIPTSDFSGGIHTVRGWTKPHLVTYMESHDEERMMYKTITFGNNASSTYNIRAIDTALKRVELDAAFFFTLPGPKMMGQFGELGYDYSINYCTNGTISNDCRTAAKPIRWDYFVDAKRRHVYTTFSALLKLRAHPWYKDLFTGNAVEQSLSGAFKWIKLTSDTSKLVVAGNFDVAPSTGIITFPTGGTWYDYLSNTPFTATGGAQSISLQPGEFHLYLNRNVNNVSTTAVTSLPLNTAILGVRAFPNPAQASFTVEVMLPQSSPVSLRLLNAAGGNIALLHEGFMPKGKTVLPVNRKSLLLPSGIYYIEMTTKYGSTTASVSLL